MQIATIMNVHNNPALVRDSLDAIEKYVGNKNVILVDGLGVHDFRGLDWDVSFVRGFNHGSSRAPYRNVALGLSMVVEKYPDVDWYVYCESDVLFTSKRYQTNLEMAAERNVWMLGNDGRVHYEPMELIAAMFKTTFSNGYYLLGCCQFFHRQFIQKLQEKDFFNRFLHLTGSFDGKTFPKFNGWDISEHMYPTLCRHLGGNIGVFASYDSEKNQWHGAYEYFPMRWTPEINADTEFFKDASVIHPMKELDHPLRTYYRNLRNE